MWLERGPASWQMQQFGEDLIGLMRVPNAGEALDQQMLQEWNRPFTSTYVAVTPTMPAWYAAFKDGVLVIAIDGSTTITQGVNFVEACGVSRVASKIPGVVTAVANQAYDIWSTLASGISLSISKVIIFGHSLGGAIAGALHAQFLRNTTSTIVQSVTYGCPRYSDESFGNFMRTEPMVRLMNSLDPVPLVPPHEGFAPAVRLVTGTEELRRWNELVHTAHGLLQHADGDRSDGELPSAAFLNPVTSLASWIATLPTNAATVHSIQTYRDLTFIYGNRVGPGASIAVPTTGVERTHSQTNYEINKEKERNAAQVYEQSHTQLSLPLRVPRQYLFTTVRLGRIWAVNFQGRTVTVGPGRRAAREMANAGNRFASRMLRSGAVDTEAVLSAFLDWFGAAASPQSGISPTIVEGL